MSAVEHECEGGPYVAAGSARVYAAIESGVLVINVYTGDDSLPIAIKVNDLAAGQMLPSRARGRHRRD